MCKFIFFLSLSLSVFDAGSQTAIDFSQWSEAELDKANTAQNVNYLSEDERQVIYYMNLARINPALFSKTVVDQYIKEREMKTTSYLTSLNTDLKKTKPMAALKVDSALFVITELYAASHGMKGQTGHVAFVQRMKNYSAAGENCAYGHSDPIDIVMVLLIDEGVSGVGHRKNILNPDYKIVAASIKDHSKYGTCCVIDFATRPAAVVEQAARKKKK